MKANEDNRSEIEEMFRKLRDSGAQRPLVANG